MYEKERLTREGRKKERRKSKKSVNVSVYGLQ
jgi:hypothetical protein